MANWTFERLIDIMRRVIGRRNDTDALSSDSELTQYLGEFLRDSMPQEMKTYENYNIYEFDTQSGIEDYTYNTNEGISSVLGDGSDVNGNVFENIGPIAWSDEQWMNWYQDPKMFYDKWGFDTDDDNPQSGQPFDILFYNNFIKLKPQPDGVYRIRIPGFVRNVDQTDASTSDTLAYNYWGRYVAYGTALDYMYDFGYDPQRIQVVENRYKKYRSLVQSRSLNQTQIKQPIPRF